MRLGRFVFNGSLSGTFTPISWTLVRSPSYSISTVSPSIKKHNLIGYATSHLNPDEQFCSNSLQTGKRIQRICQIHFYHHNSSFNSLQTGKRIQSQLRAELEKARAEKFQFPSNGKAYPKRLPTQDFYMYHSVSIPFKRESVSKAQNNQIVQDAAAFQFPSNGKAYPKKRSIE